MDRTTRAVLRFAAERMKQRAKTCRDSAKVHATSGPTDAVPEDNGRAFAYDQAESFLLGLVEGYEMQTPGGTKITIKEIVEKYGAP